MVRVWLSVNLKRHGIDCGRSVGRIGPWTRADRSRTWPHLGHKLDTGGSPFSGWIRIRDDDENPNRHQTTGDYAASVGIPNRRNLPPVLGIIRARTGNGRKLRSLTLDRSSSRNSSTPCNVSMDDAVRRSTSAVAAPLFPLTRS